MDRRDTEFGAVSWIHPAQDIERWWSLANTVMNEVGFEVLTALSRKIFWVVAPCSLVSST
jgi:hypothetical protein